MSEDIITKEVKNMLSAAADELKRLRHSHEILQARVDTFDAMMLLFTSQPNFRHQGMSEDIVWKIERYLEEGEV